MRREYTKLFLINYVYILILELLFKIFIMSSLDIGLLYISIFTLPVASVITFITSLFKKKGLNRFCSILVWFLIYAIFFAETIYFSFYKTICGLSALGYGGQVMEFFSSIWQHIVSHSILLIGAFVPFIVLLILSFTKRIKHEKYDAKVTLALFFATLFFGMSSLELDEGAKNLYFNTNDLLESTNTLGISSAISLDAIKLVTGFEENIDFVSKKLDYTKDEKTEYNMMNIDFDKFISSENDSTLKSMHEYFKNQEPSNKNKYTGIFAGKNLIFITAEGFYPIAVNEELTPTLYKLVNNGFVFNNYYQPIYNCSTSDGEFINQLSILPGVSTCSMKSTISTYLPFNVGSIMKNYGYNTYAFHGWTYNYYSRDKTMPNLGYEYYGYDRYNKGFKNAIKGIKDAWPTSDVDVVNNTYDIYSGSEHFVAYYMSISGHLQYNFGGNAQSRKNKEAVSGLKANETIKAYIASQIEFDKSLEILINDLKNSGKLEDTVIVIGADHYPYGLTNDEISSYVDWMKDANFDLYKNNLVIYNSEMEKTEVNKYVSSLDILPTLLNLFGVEYDSRLLFGRDIFSDASDLVIFNNKSWITDKGRYNYIKKKFTPFEGVTVDDSYVNEINEIVKLKFQMSKLVISKDYYRKILG